MVIIPPPESNALRKARLLREAIQPLGDLQFTLTSRSLQRPNPTRVKQTVTNHLNFDYESWLSCPSRHYRSPPGRLAGHCTPRSPMVWRQRVEIARQARAARNSRGDPPWLRKGLPDTEGRIPEAACQAARTIALTPTALTETGRHRPSKPSAMRLMLSSVLSWRLSLRSTPSRKPWAETRSLYQALRQVREPMPRALTG